MTPEASEAIRIADKHLAGESAERRKALALDIQQTIARLGGEIAADLIREAITQHVAASNHPATVLREFNDYYQGPQRVPVQVERRERGLDFIIRFKLRRPDRRRETHYDPEVERLRAALNGSPSK